MILWIAAANRDATRFSGPDRFDVHRTSTGRLAFGHGIHFCIGASLVRLEAKIAPDLTLDRILRHRSGHYRSDRILQLVDDDHREATAGARRLTSRSLNSCPENTGRPEIGEETQTNTAIAPVSVLA